MEEILHDLFAIDNILAIIFIIFLYLQHVREKERSQNFFNTVNGLIDIVNKCQEKMTRGESDRTVT